MEELKGTKECLIRSFVFCYNNNRFNLPSDPVPLMGLRRQIPIGKTSLFTEKKPIFR